MDNTEHNSTEEGPTDSRSGRYSYMKSDGTLDIVAGSLIAGLGAYAYTFITGRSLGEEAFAPITVLLTAHFLAFIIVLMPIEQLIIRRLTLGYRGWVVPARAIALALSAGAAAAFVVGVAGDDYFDSRREFVIFALLTVLVHFFFAVGRGYLAGFRRFRSYGYSSAGASMFRLAIAVGVAIVAPSVTGFAWAHVAGPLVIVFWRPWRVPGGVEQESEPETVDGAEKGLLAGLVLAAAASQALLLAGPLVASWLGASNVQASVTYATLLIARAPLTLGYNLIARVLPPFTQMAVQGERRELRAWARGIGIATAILAIFGALIGGLIGPALVSVAFGSGFAPSSAVAAIAGAGVVLAGGGLFIGQTLVARGQSLRLGMAWLVAVAVSGSVVLLPIDDPVLHVMIAFFLGELAALAALVYAALLLDPDETATSHGYAVAKRSMDIAGSVVALVLLFPVLLVAAIAVRLDSPGPGFFRQRRVGRNGRGFWMIKLRTMAIDHDEEVFRAHINRLRDSGEKEVDYSIRIDEDPRVTKVGAILRKWSIDEFPNFWNVLKGTMSLVGPRPLVREEAELIGLDNVRFEVKPGVTGLAQIHGRDSISLSERTKWDDRYVAERSTKMDMRIMLATVRTVFVSPGEEREPE